MKHFKLLSLILVLCAATATGWAQRRTAKGAFEVRVGKERKVEGADLKIAFLEVTEDSRCPEGAMCVWAGNARARMTVSTSQGDCAEFALNTHLQPIEFQFGEYTIRLQRLTPAPSIHAELKPSEYKAELVITKVEKK